MEIDWLYHRDSLGQARLLSTGIKSWRMLKAWLRTAQLYSRSIGKALLPFRSNFRTNWARGVDSEKEILEVAGYQMIQ